MIEDIVNVLEHISVSITGVSFVLFGILLILGVLLCVYYALNVDKLKERREKLKNDRKIKSKDK